MVYSYYPLNHIIFLSKTRFFFLDNNLFFVFIPRFFQVFPLLNINEYNSVIVIFFSLVIILHNYPLFFTVFCSTVISFLSIFFFVFQENALKIFICISNFIKDFANEIIIIVHLTFSSDGRNLILSLGNFYIFRCVCHIFVRSHSNSNRNYYFFFCMLLLLLYVISFGNYFSGILEKIYIKYFIFVVIIQIKINR